MRSQRSGPARWVFGVAVAASVLGLAAIASPAAAAFDQIKVREVLPGVSEYDPDGPEFVELQTFADGQNTVNGQVVAFYGPTGAVKGTFTIPTDVANGTSQRSILIGTGAFGGVAPDFTYAAAFLETDGGAVCYGNIDCVAWGSFPGAGSAPIIPHGKSLTRSIAPGCATLLEAADDSGNSRTDFAVTPASPRNNAATPTERACDAPPATAPDTAITKAPKKKTAKRTAAFRFTSSERAASFECRIDNRRFQPCSSPISYGKDGKKLKRGRHSFEVVSINGGLEDRTPARFAWRIKKKGTKKATGGG